MLEDKVAVSLSHSLSPSQSACEPPLPHERQELLKMKLSLEGLRKRRALKVLTSDESRDKLTSTMEETPNFRQIVESP